MSVWYRGDRCSPSVARFEQKSTSQEEYHDRTGNLLVGHSERAPEEGGGGEEDEGQEEGRLGIRY